MDKKITYCPVCGRQDDECICYDDENANTFQKQEMKTLYDLALETVAPDDRKLSEHQENEIAALMKFAEQVISERNSKLDDTLKTNQFLKLVYVSGDVKKTLGWAVDSLQWEVWSMSQCTRRIVWHYKGDDFSEALNKLLK